MKKVILLIILAFSLSINAQEKTNLSKTDEVLSKAIEKGIELAEKTGTFIIEQAPDLLQEFYAWKLYSNIGLAITMLILIISIFLITKRVAKYTTDNSVYLFNLFQIFPFGFLIYAIYNIMFITVAPKIYLINYFVK